MPSNSNGLPMSFLAVLDGLFPDLYLPDFVVVAGAFFGEHVLLIVSRRVPCNIGAADVTD